MAHITIQNIPKITYIDYNHNHNNGYNGYNHNHYYGYNGYNHNHHNGYNGYITITITNHSGSKIMVIFNPGYKERIVIHVWMSFPGNGPAHDPKIEIWDHSEKIFWMSFLGSTHKD